MDSQPDSPKPIKEAIDYPAIVDFRPLILSL